MPACWTAVRTELVYPQCILRPFGLCAAHTVVSWGDWGVGQTPPHLAEVATTDDFSSVYLKASKWL